jgi:bis(5'-nucleosyl)-tetraphosphatase (symmetrical)
VFIGDVQGCADELDALLARARESFGDDFTVWLVGDLVNRGPASLRVLERVRALWEQGRARCVLGNHDISLMSVAWGLRERRPGDSFDDVLGAPDLADWLDWLRRLPVAETGRIGAQEFAMVHASVMPEWELSDLRAAADRVSKRLSGDLRSARAFLATPVARDSDREALARLTTCRSVSRDGRWSPEPPAGDTVAWHQAWSKRRHDYGVVYGHWSLQGLHVSPGLRGLDTGCVHHGRGRDGFLTAWIPDASKRKPFDTPDDSCWQERARRRYYRELDAS